MANKDKIKALLARLNSLEENTSVDDISVATERLINQETQKIRDQMRDNPTIKSLSLIASKLQNFKKEFNLKPVIESVSDLSKEMEGGQKKLLIDFDSKINVIKNEFKDNLTRSFGENKEEIARQISIAFLRVDAINNDFSKIIDNLIKNGASVNQTLEQSLIKIAEIEKSISIYGQENKKEIDGLRAYMLSKFAELGGGAAHQKIMINGSVMSLRYADFSFTNDTAIRWSATDDNTNKRVNIRASVVASGSGGAALTVKEGDGVPTVLNVNTIVVSNGTLTDNGGGQVTVATGGGGSGITRSASIVSVSSTFGAVTNTDYAAFANVGIAITLPTAVNNSNLYTVKNVSASSVLVATTGGETIDGSATALLTTTYQSIDLLSDNSGWNVI